MRTETEQTMIPISPLSERFCILLGFILLILFSGCSMRNVKAGGFSNSDNKESLKQRVIQPQQLKQADKAEQTYAQDGSLIEKRYYPNGILKAERRFLDNRLDGTTKIYYQSAMLHEKITYIKGELNGSYKIYNDDLEGTLKQEAAYKNGKFHGTIKVYDELVHYLSRGRRTEEYLDNLTKDQSNINFLGAEYNYVDGEQIGTQKYYYPDAKVEQICEIEKIEKGNTKMVCTRYHDGIGGFDGTGVSSKPEIPLSRCEYLNGKENGICKQYYSDGSLESGCEYTDGKKHGLCTSHKYESGIVYHYIDTYNNGAIVNRKAYDAATHKLIFEQSY